MVLAVRSASLGPVGRGGVRLADGGSEEGVNCGIVTNPSGCLPWLGGTVLGTLLGGVEPLPSPDFLFGTGGAM